MQMELDIFKKIKEVGDTLDPKRYGDNFRRVRDSVTGIKDSDLPMEAKTELLGIYKDVFVELAKLSPDTTRLNELQSDLYNSLRKNGFADQIIRDMDNSQIYYKGTPEYDEYIKKQGRRLRAPTHGEIAAGDDVFEGAMDAAYYSDVDGKGVASGAADVVRSGGDVVEGAVEGIKDLADGSSEGGDAAEAAGNLAAVAASGADLSGAAGAAAEGASGLAEGASGLAEAAPAILEGLAALSEILAAFG